MSEFHGGPQGPYQPNPQQPQDPNQRPQYDPRAAGSGTPHNQVHDVPKYVYQAPQPPKPPKKHRTRNILLGVGAGLVVLIGAATASGDPEAPVSVTSQATQPVDNGPTPDPVTTPTNKPTVAKTTQPPAKTTPPPKPKPVVYKKLTARQWAKIAKSPDSHAGEAYIVYGVVTQFDSATGDDQFRADVDGVKHKVEYGFVDYPTNTLMTNIGGDVSDLVEDDLFTAKVLVMGSFSYDTQIGGETTVPQLSVMSITVTGSVK